MVRKVWLDTNFLMIPVQFRVDIFEELHRLLNEPFELLIASGTLDELKFISGGRGEDAGAARIGLKLIEGKGVKVVQSSGNVDDWLVERAVERDFVCTNDIGLIRRLRETKVRRIQLKGKTHLDFAY